MYNYNLLDETKRILRENSIRLRKRLGQSFITDSKYISKQLQAGELDKEDTVLEIGAGIGNLTIKISPLVKKIYAIELDESLVEILRKRSAEYDNIEILECDALKCEYPHFNKIVANIPYNIASPLTFKILSYKFEIGVLMYQLEFAKRLIAKPGSANYCRLSVNAALRTDVQILEIVPRTAFYPRPKVDSAIVKLLPKKEIKIKSNLEAFTKIVNELFLYKNKKLHSAIKHYMDRLNIIKDVQKQVLYEAPYSDLRVRELDINMIDELVTYLSNKMRDLL
ncbi:MAG: 16S rRNA (adenine(1518)-N(6)/adenine(1519)-N(6))-dimethyltransferase RsmA [Candidatus Odinarchaeota archaeon]